MMAGIRDILLISTPLDLPLFRRLLGDGSDFGVNLSYAEQPSPDGLAQAFIIGADWLAGEAACLVLGDNIFHGAGLSRKLQQAVARAQASTDSEATVFGYHVNDPQRYGVAEFDPHTGRCISIEEKPANPRSEFAVVGLYFYPADVVQKALRITPSARGELEITSLNCLYLDEQRLHIDILGNGFAWLDTGTHDSLAEASAYIETIEKRQGLKIACLEGIAFERNWISSDDLRRIAAPMLANDYGRYLMKLASKNSSNLS